MDMERIDIRNVYDLLATFALGSDEIDTYLGEVIPNTDDNARVEVLGPMDYYSGRINGQPEIIREGMLKAHNSITHYLSLPQDLTQQAMADLLLKLAQAYYRQDLLHREDSLGYAYFYANRSLETKESAQGHLLMARLLISLTQKNNPETSSGTPPPATLRAAARAIETALSIDPTLVEGHLLAADLHQRLGEIDAVIAAYQKIIEINPRTPDPYYTLATLLQSQGKGHEARRYYEKFLALASQTKADTRLVELAKKQIMLLGNPNPAIAH